MIKHLFRNLHVNADNSLSLSSPGAPAGSTFTPSGTPKAWYDASQIVGLGDGDPVATWPDLANSNDLLQVGGDSLRPVYNLNQQNTLPAIQYDGSQLLQVAWAEVAQPNTIFVVCKLASTPQDGTYVIDGETQGRNAVYINGTKYSCHATTSFFDSTVTVDTDFHVISILFNGASSIYNVDGVETLGSTGTDGCDGITTGASNSEATSLIGSIAEIIMYNGNESLAANEAGLMTKWGIT